MVGGTETPSGGNTGNLAFADHLHGERENTKKHAFKQADTM